MPVKGKTKDLHMMYPFNPADLTVRQLRELRASVHEIHPAWHARVIAHLVVGALIAYAYYRRLL